MKAARLLGVLWLGVLAGCHDQPSGPGTLEATVTGADLSGVLLQVDGAGIRSFAARGDARVYAVSDAERPDRHRVVIITPGSGSFAFSMEVDDRRMEGPTVTVLQATGADNTPLTPASATVRIVR